ncbi:hypothetical protein XENTR_v10018894 [Xenopus tropicalis]|nr:hypothetical protein XENTR_v10018894 [Xenopus tropicalis]
MLYNRALLLYISLGGKNHVSKRYHSGYLQNLQIQSHAGCYMNALYYTVPHINIMVALYNEVIYASCIIIFLYTYPIIHNVS